VPNICCFLLQFHRFATFSALSLSGTEQKVCGTDFDFEGVEMLVKMIQNKKKQIFGTGAKFSRELN